MRFFMVFLMLILTGCSHSFRFEIDPPGGRLLVDGQSFIPGEQFHSREEQVQVEVSAPEYVSFSRTVENKSFIKTTSLYISLEKKHYPFTLKALEGEYSFVVDNTWKGMLPLHLHLTSGEHMVILQDREKRRQRFFLEVRGREHRIIRPQPGLKGMVPLGLLECGSQPKQVIFSPDSRHVYTTLLDGKGYQVFDVQKKRKIRDRSWPDGHKGFVEGIFIEEKELFLVSNMETEKIHLVEYKNDHTLKASYSTLGIGPKIMAYCPGKEIVAVSNWFSGSVVILELATGKPVKMISGLETPRGIAFTHDGSFMLVTSFEGGNILRFRTSDWKETGRIHIARAAMRHVVINEQDSTAWVSDMNFSNIYEVDLGAFKITRTIPVYHNPNTIDLTPEERFLFVSCRGPNHPQSYLYRSPRNGQIIVIDLKLKKVVRTIMAGNQPTGLDISPDGKTLCFSNFKDNNLELYDIRDLY